MSEPRWTEHRWKNYVALARFNAEKAAGRPFLGEPSTDIPNGLIFEVDEELSALQQKLQAAEALVGEWRRNFESPATYIGCAQELEEAIGSQNAQSSVPSE